MRFRHAAMYLAMLSLAGCETCEDGENPFATATGGTIAANVSPTNARIAQGASATFGVSFTRSQFTGSVTFASNPPAGLSVAFAPNETVPAGSNTLSFTVTAAADAEVQFDNAGNPVSRRVPITYVMQGGGIGGFAVDVTVVPSALAGITISAAPAVVFVRPGSTVDATVTLARQGNYTGRVSYELQGLPNGVTGVVTPTADASRFQLRFTAAANAETRDTPVPVTIRATGEGLTQAVTTTIAVGVGAPGFRISPRDELLGDYAGRERTTTLFITRNGGFNGPVQLVTESVPAGFTVTLSPAEVTDLSSTVTIRTLASTPPGDYTLRFRGTAQASTGLPASTTSMTFRVHPAPFTLGVSDVSVMAGNSASTVVTVSRAATFTAPVTVAVARANGAALPTGMTLTVETNPITGVGGPLRVQTTAATPAGVYDFVLTGTSPDLPNATVPFKVTVTPPLRATTIAIRRVENGATVPTTGEALVAGASVSLAAEVRDQNNQIMTGQLVLWSTSNGAVATVTNLGVVRGEAAGSTTITAALASDVTVKADLPVTVTAPISNVARIEIEPKNAEITVPATQQYRVLFYDASGARTTVEQGGVLQFVTSHATGTGPADVNATTGLAVGRAAGTTTVTARYLRNGQFVTQDATPLTVYAAGSPGHVGSITISTDNNNTREIARGTPLRFQLQVRDVNGSAVTSGLDPAPSASVSNPNITLTPITNPAAEGLPPGYFWRITVPASVPVGTRFTVRYDARGAGGEITMTVGQ